MKNNYQNRNRMHDQAARQRFLEQEKRVIQQGKIALVCLLGLIIIVILAICLPANADVNVWQAVSDKSLVDMWGEE